MTKKQSLTLEEQETIINFNKSETMASIFTYDESWQKHLEERLGLVPISDNGFGAREYLIDKHRIRPPRPVVRKTPEQKKQSTAILAEARRQKSLDLGGEQVGEQ